MLSPFLLYAFLMADSITGTDLSGKAGENAAKAATVQAEKPQLNAEAPEIAADTIEPKKARSKAAEGERISVLLSRMVYRSRYTHNSTSVKQLQRRLVELGFVEAGADPAGLFADGTKAAVEGYQAEHNLDVTGEVDAKTLKAVFRNDKSVNVVLD